MHILYISAQRPDFNIIIDAIALSDGIVIIVLFHQNTLSDLHKSICLKLVYIHTRTDPGGIPLGRVSTCISCFIYQPGHLMTHEIINH